ncbi:MAG: hypothetical protein QG597_2309 [Actinomycetota bacterium]|nr:hypothetical protein [Actinomycetota bacterium]
MSGIREALERRFAAQRVVFWHDPSGDYSADVDALALDDVTTIRVANDEYAVKHRLLHLEPTAKFLVYRSDPVPDGIGNWLLDLELAYGVFTADRASLMQQQLGLTGEGVGQVIADHESFFRAAKRVQALKGLVDAGDDATLLQAKMCAVLLGQREHSLLELTRTMLIENSTGADDKYASLVEYGLDGFYWQGAASIYGYSSASPSIDDFVLWLFRRAMQGFASDRPGGLRNIQLDFGSFRYDIRSRQAMIALAGRAAADLNIAAIIEGAELGDLVDNDLFEDVDRAIISGLARQVAERTITPREVADVVRARQASLWIDEYRSLYEALLAAAQLLTAISTLDTSMTSFDDGLARYRRDWFALDQLYRHFIHAVRTTEQGGPLEVLRAQVESFYTNQFLFTLGAAWQQQVDSVTRWASQALPSQTAFYADRVAPVTRDPRRKAVVIISDALRYEVADELGSRIRQEDRYDAELDAVLGVLPSYTQLGMAALLPHRTLAFSGKRDLVTVDGQPSDGTANRAKILHAVKGTAVQAEDVLAMPRDEIRALYQDHQVLFIYHNRIDAVGDKQGTERNVFEAAEEALRELVQLVKKLTGANATNILVTADHGFLFQDSAIDEVGYLSEAPQGDELAVQARRYVIGRGLKDDAAFVRFTSEQLGLAGDHEVLIPKSIHRLRLKGSGARFVHGGASLQEAVVPVLTINKKRKGDVRPVNVELLPETDKITTGQLVVKLFQAEPVSEKVQPRTLRAGLYVGETLISNEVLMVFDVASDDKRDRYQRAVMLLSQDAADYNDRTVEFRLEEQIPNTNQWRVYATAMYTLKRPFAGDFDF